MAVVPQDLREQVLERDGHQCRYCGSRKKPLQVDHVYPESAGGQTILENLAAACYYCNMEKRQKIGVWPKPPGYFCNPLRRFLVFWWKMFEDFSVNYMTQVKATKRRPNDPNTTRIYVPPDPDPEGPPMPPEDLSEFEFKPTMRSKGKSGYLYIYEATKKAKGFLSFSTKTGKWRGPTFYEDE